VRSPSSPPPAVDARGSGPVSGSSATVPEKHLICQRRLSCFGGKTQKMRGLGLLDRDCQWYHRVSAGSACYGRSRRCLVSIFVPFRAVSDSVLGGVGPLAEKVGRRLVRPLLRAFLFVLGRPRYGRSASVPPRRFTNSTGWRRRRCQCRPLNSGPAFVRLSPADARGPCPDNVGVCVVKSLVQAVA